MKKKFEVPTKTCGENVCKQGSKVGVCHPEIQEVWFMRLNRDLGETISCNLVVHTINNHPSPSTQLTKFRSNKYS